MTHRTPTLGMVLKGYPRISETFISNEIRLLEQAGIKIHIFSMRHPRESFTHKSVEEIQAQVTYLPSDLFRSLHRFLLPNLYAALAHPIGYARAVRLALRRVVRTRSITTSKHLLQAGFLVHRAHGLTLTHLHAHFAHSPTSVAMFAAEITGMPFSFTGHAKDIYTSSPQQLAEKIAKAQFVLTCTQYNLRYLASLNKEATPLHCVYHGIDVQLFTPRDAHRQPLPPYTILTIARFVEKKGLDDILEALARLAAVDFPFRYILIGDGEEKERITTKIKALGLEEQVTLTGTLPHDQVLHHFQEADCFILGCKIAANGDRDGIPNVLAESMAMGVPVVATAISGIPELVAHERTGLLLAAVDPEETAATLRRILTDQPLREQLIPAAQAEVDKIFDNRKLAQELVGLYRQLARL